MPKIYIIIAIMIAASGVFVALPGLLEHAAHYVHFLGLVVGGHHLSDIIAHSIHPRSVHHRMRT